MCLFKRVQISAFFRQFHSFTQITPLLAEFQDMFFNFLVFNNKEEQIFSCYQRCMHPQNNLGHDPVQIH